MSASGSPEDLLDMQTLQAYASPGSLGTSTVLSEWAVTIRAALTHSLLSTGHYQAFAFAQDDGAAMASPGGFLWVHTALSHTMRLDCCAGWCLPFHFAATFACFSTYQRFFSFTTQSKTSSETPSSKCLLLLSLSCTALLS